MSGMPNTNGEIGPRCSADPAHNRTMTETTHRQNTADTTDAPTPDHGDEITTLDEANAAVDAGMVLRIQPQSPKATRYAALVDGGWARKHAVMHGQARWARTSTDHVRSMVERAIERGGHGVSTVMALDAGREERFDGERLGR